MTVETPPTARSQDSPAATAILGIAAVVLGIGAASENPDSATAISALALVLVAAGLLQRRLSGQRIGSRISVDVLLVGVVAAVVVLLIRPKVPGVLYLVSIATSGGLAVASILSEHFRGLLLSASLLVQTLSLCLAISTTPATDIDVYWFGQLGSEALLQGQNPYAINFPNIYGADTDLYAPEVLAGDVVKFGYPYPPLSLLLGLPGYLVAGDFRYAAVVAVTITGLLAYWARPGALSAAAAVLLVTSPLTLQVLLKAWIEPFAGLAFAVAAVAALRIPRLFPYVLGLALVIKQYMAPLWLLALLLVPSKSSVDRTVLAIAPLIVAAAIILPFLIWSPSHFTFDVIVLQALQPFREDSVSLPGLLARAGGVQLPTWIAFVAAGAAIVLVARYARQTVAGLSGAAAFVFLVFFFLSKQAFMNYYFFAFVLLIFAVALATFDRPDRQEARHTTPGTAEAIG
jgi:hypothetical protein